MNKNKLIELKIRVLALSLAGVMIGTTGCSLLDKDGDGVPDRAPISSEYYKFDEYYKYVVQDAKAIKVYKTENIYLLYNKETYDAEEYIYDTVLGRYGGQLYDLESEELLVYSSGINYSCNKEYYNYLCNNNYSVCLKDASDYIEGYQTKDYYSLDEIKELEPQLVESLKLINKEKVKTK